MITRHRISTIPGDEIGKETMPDGLRAQEAAGPKFGIDYEIIEDAGYAIAAVI